MGPGKMPSPGQSVQAGRAVSSSLAIGEANTRSVLLLRFLVVAFEKKTEQGIYKSWANFQAMAHRSGNKGQKSKHPARL